MTNLQGKHTPDGWLIAEQVVFAADHTGGYFSDCYYVTKGNSKAFLKALDIEKFDLQALMGVVSGFQYEAALLHHCREKKLSRIIRVIEAGEIEVNPAAPPLLRNVPFLVLELASDDIRKSVDISQTVSARWCFRILHQTTLGLLQLHGQAIAHQDLKPSNVLRIDSETLKIGDLGRSSQRGRPAPHDAIAVPGASNYAPFEQIYGYLPADWIKRRLAADVFHLGCLTIFTFTNICFPEFVMHRLAPAYRPDQWGRPYIEVLPHVVEASIASIQELEADFPEPFRKEIAAIALDLCNPDPARRGLDGIQKASAVGPLWLQTYVAKFDVLEKRARLKKSHTHA